METSEVVTFEVLDEGVELLGGVFILISESGNTDAESAWHVSDSVDPDGSVKAGVDSHLLKESATLKWTYLSEHLLGSEASDFAKGAWGSLLELDALEALVHVECVVALNWLQFCLLSVSAHVLVLLLFLPLINNSIEPFSPHIAPWRVNY